MKRFFFIDTENVGKTFLKGIEKLTMEDTIILCNNNSVYQDFSPAILNGLTRTKATIKKFYINNIYKNAMDFEIAIELGFLVAENGNHAKYYVVSNDKAFDVVADYMVNKGLKTEVRRISSLDAHFEKEENKKQMEATIKFLLPEYSNKVVRRVVQGIEQTNSLCELHNYLQARFKNDYMIIYPRIKQLIV